MRQHLFGVLFTLLSALPLAADEAGNPDIQAVITHQLDAFQADDFATAFGYASPMIQGIFGNSDNFGAMVQQGYPMVWRPGDVQMLELRTMGGAWWQRVRITDQAGHGHVLEYQMIETPDGWLINGVRLLPEPGVGA